MSSAILPTKRFKGAPFGIQTSRFDVSGVHPKSKTAGGYTEIPYDKNYIDELSNNFNGCGLGEKCKNNGFVTDFSKVSAENDSLSENKVMHAFDCKVYRKKVKTLNSLGKSPASNKRTSMLSLRCATWQTDYFLDSVVERQIKMSRKSKQMFQNALNKVSKLTFLKETNDILNVNNIKCIKQRMSHQNEQSDHMNVCLETSLSERNNYCYKASAAENHNANANPNNSDSPDQNSETNTQTETISKESSNQSERSSAANESNSIIYEESSDSTLPVIEVEKDTSAPLKSALSKTKKMDDTTKRVSFESNPKTLTTEDIKSSMTVSSKRSSMDENILADAEQRRSINRVSVTRKMSLSGKEGVEVDQDILDQAMLIMKNAGYSAVDKTAVPREDEDVCSTDLPKQDLSKFARVYINDLITGLTSTLSEGPEKVCKSPTVFEDPQTFDSGKLSYSEDHPTGTGTPEASIPMAKSDDSSIFFQNKGSISDSTSVRNEEELKLLQDNESQEISIGVPPNSVMEFADLKSQLRKKKIDKLLKVPYESCDSFLKRKLGPGVYNLMIATEEERSTFQQAPRTGWSRQLELERLAALPHLLYKEQWEEKKMLQKKLGPGSYNIKDFIEINNSKPRSGRGICDNLAPRFENKLMSATPGPGTYGIDGIPQRAVEMKSKKSASTKGILDAGDRKRNLPSVGSHLGPGTYKHTTCTDQLLNKATGLKGPYNLFSPERDGTIIAGHFATMKPTGLGPGQYDVKSFVDELENEHKRTQGRFAKVQQYPEFSYQEFPGPASYDIKHHNRKCSHGVNIPGFFSSAKRDDKISQKFFSGNHNPVGPGRYDIQKYDEAQSKNGCVSAFKSKTNKPNQKLYRFLQERLRPKDLSPEDKAISVDPYKMTRSITIM